MASADEWCYKHKMPRYECTRAGHHPPGNTDYGRAEPTDPVGPIGAASIEFKTVYDSLLENEFTPAQALYLVASQITGNPGIAPGLEPPTE